MAKHPQHESQAEEIEQRERRLEIEQDVAERGVLHQDHGTERGAPLAPHQNRPPAEQHRGGPLPYKG